MQVTPLAIAPGLQVEGNVLNNPKLVQQVQENIGQNDFAILLDALSSQAGQAEQADGILSLIDTNGTEVQELLSGLEVEKAGIPLLSNGNKQFTGIGTVLPSEVTEVQEQHARQSKFGSEVLGENNDPAKLKQQVEVMSDRKPFFVKSVADTAVVDKSNMFEKNSVNEMLRKYAGKTTQVEDAASRPRSNEVNIKKLILSNGNTATSVQEKAPVVSKQFQVADILNYKKGPVRDSQVLSDMDTGTKTTDLERILQVSNKNPNQNGVMTEVSSNPVKVLDFSQINTSNAIELIDKISDYVRQNNLQNTQALDLTVKHDTLGEFKLNVNKVRTQDSMDMEILTTTNKGREFFVENENRLMQSLSNAGLKVAEIKIAPFQDRLIETNDESKKSTQNEQSHSRSDDSRNDSDGRRQEDRDSRRRQELWEEFSERLGA